MDFKSYFAINEMFGSFNYQVPDDKEQQLYDFYMLVWLKGRSSFDAKLDKLRQSGDIPGMASPPKPEFTGDMTEEDKIDYMLQEMASSLFPYLKKNLLGAVFYALCAEFRHSIEQTRAEGLLTIIQKKFAPEYAELFKKFVEKYTLLYHHGNTFADTKGIRNPEYKSGKNQVERNHAFAAMNSVAENREQAVRLMKYIFGMGFWHGSYGGEAWERIADGWLRLNDANSESKMVVAIDHIYDLQHNTDTVFNKLASYYKQENGYGWIKKALDKKAKIKDPHELINKISSGFKKLAYRAIKMKTGKTLEDFNKENKSVLIKKDFNSMEKTGGVSYEEIYFKMAMKYLPELFEKTTSEFVDGIINFMHENELLSQTSEDDQYRFRFPSPNHYAETAHNMASWVNDFYLGSINHLFDNFDGKKEDAILTKAYKQLYKYFQREISDILVIYFSQINQPINHLINDNAAINRANDVIFNATNDYAIKFRNFLLKVVLMTAKLNKNQAGLSANSYKIDHEKIDFLNKLMPSFNDNTSSFQELNIARLFLTIFGESVNVGAVMNFVTTYLQKSPLYGKLINLWNIHKNEDKLQALIKEETVFRHKWANVFEGMNLKYFQNMLNHPQGVKLFRKHYNIISTKSIVGQIDYPHISDFQKYNNMLKANDAASVAKATEAFQKETWWEWQPAFSVIYALYLMKYYQHWKSGAKA